MKINLELPNITPIIYPLAPPQTLLNFIKKVKEQSYNFISSTHHFSDMNQKMFL